MASEPRTRPVVPVILLAIVVTAVLLVPIAAMGARKFLYEPFRIPSAAMAPTLVIGDHIIVDKQAYAAGKLPDHGDVIVFRYPRDLTIHYVKRVVGVPGDRVAVRNNRVVLNGVEQPTTPVPNGAFVDDNCKSHAQAAYTETLAGKPHAMLTNIGLGGALSDRDEVTVPPGQYFVIGDNRDNSEDSRRWGYVPFDDVEGKVTSVWASPDPCTGNPRVERAGQPL